MKVLLMQSNALSIPLPNESVHCVVTSPPYWGLRDYQVEGQLGLEPTPEEYIANMVSVFREVKRVLRDDGVCFLNLGDSYVANKTGGQGNNSSGLEGGRATQHAAGNRPDKFVADLKPKDLIGIPWRVALALQADGWWLRSDIIWHKPNPMPESVTDRPTKSHEYIFLLTKSARYFYDADSIREGDQVYTRKASGYIGFENTHTGNNQKGGFADRDTTTVGRNKRSVWTITTKPYSGAHFATFPPELPEICIKAGTSEKGVCPECGAQWERVVERTGGPPTSAKEREELGIDRKPSSFGAPVDETETGVNGQRNWRPPAGQATFETLGWQPTCSHEHNPGPPVVLDPFSGSGTTAMVANQLGRVGIGLDLSWEYLQLAKERTGMKAIEEYYNGRRAEANLEGLPMFNA